MTSPPHTDSTDEEFELEEAVEAEGAPQAAADGSFIGIDNRGLDSAARPPSLAPTTASSAAAAGEADEAEGPLLQAQRRPGLLTSVLRLGRRRWPWRLGQANPNAASAAPSPTEGRLTRRRRMPRQVGSIRRNRTLGDEVNKRMRLKQLKALLRGNEVGRLVTKEDEKQAIWHGLFNIWSPTDTGGVLGSMICVVLLAASIIACAETSKSTDISSKFESVVWIAAETLACIILGYNSFLLAIIVFSQYQFHLQNKRKANRGHIKRQRELMKRLKEGIRQQSQGMESMRLEEPHQLQQSNTGTGGHGNVSNTTLIPESAGQRRRQDRLELVLMMQELERLIQVDLSLLGLQRSDMDLLDQALGPKIIGSAWVSATCRVSLYKAHGHTATAYARLQRF